MEAMGQQERDELEKRAREERMEMVANAERMDREQEERAKVQIGEALVSLACCFIETHCGPGLMLLRCVVTNYEPKKYEKRQIAKRMLEPKHWPELYPHL
jgi:hypothetical protein